MIDYLNGVFALPHLKHILAWKRQTELLFASLSVKKKPQERGQTILSADPQISNNDIVVRRKAK